MEVTTATVNHDIVYFQNVDEGKYVESDFYFGHVEVNTKPVQFVLVTDR